MTQGETVVTFVMKLAVWCGDSSVFQLLWEGKGLRIAKERKRQWRRSKMLVVTNMHKGLVSNKDVGSYFDIHSWPGQSFMTPHPPGSPHLIRTHEHYTLSCGRKSPNQTQGPSNSVVSLVIARICAGLYWVSIYTYQPLELVPNTVVTLPYHCTSI